LAALDREGLVPSKSLAASTGCTGANPYWRYRLKRVLGYGGIGRVWLAYDRQLKREVALKEILPQRADDGNLHTRLLLEAEITGGLQHPGVVPVHDLAFRTDTGRAFYVMPCIHGQTLSEAITAFHQAHGSWKSGRLELARILEALINVSNTVGYAHARGVIHRDLKGSNVILGEFGEVVVLDWGFAKNLGDGRSPDSDSGGLGDDQGEDTGACHTRGEFRGTTQGQVLGTPSYMAPEQARRRYDQVGPWSDVFSLGAILYEILTGRPPFGGKTIEEIIGKVSTCTFDPPRRKNRAIPKALEAVCLKAMASEPAERHESAIALANDLRRWRADEPLSAWKEPVGLRIRRWIGRHKTPESIAAVVGFAVIILAGLGSTWQHRAEILELRRSEEARRHAQQLDEQTRRHAEQVNDVSYVNAEKTAAEIIRQQGPGWVTRATEELGKAAAIATPMRSVTTLRSLAVEAAAGFDLREQPRGRLTSINSACLAFSPDGRRLAVGEHHQQLPSFYRVQVFDLRTRTMVAEYAIQGGKLDTKQTGVSALAFSPNGRWLAAGLRNGQIQVRDTSKPTGSPLTLSGHEKQIRGLAFTPDGVTLVSGSQEGMTIFWAEQPAWRECFHFNVNDVISSLAMSKGGALGLGCDHSGRIYQVSGLKLDASEFRSVASPDGGLTQLAFSPDGQTLAANANSSQIRLGHNFDKSQRVLVDPDFGEAHTKDINRLEFHPDGSLLTSGSGDNTLKIWDIAAHQLRLRMTVLTEAMVVPAFSPDGRTLAVASSRGTTLYEILGGETTTMRALADEPVREFDFVAGSRWDPPVLAATSQDPIAGARPDNRILTFWNSRSSVPIKSLDFYERGGSDGKQGIIALDAHPSRPLVASNKGFQVSLYDVDDGKPVCSVPEEHSTALRFSRDGQQLWGVIDELQVVSWTLPNLTLRTRWALDETIQVEGRIGIACLAAGSQYVAAGSRAGFVYVFRTADGQQQRILKAKRPIQSIALSPDDSVVICGLIDGTLAVFEPVTGERVAELPAHRDTINGVAFHRDGRLLATASTDKTLGLWNVDGHSSPAELLRIPSPSGRPVLSVKFSPDGQILGMLVQNEYGVRLWRLDRIRSKLAALGLDWSENGPASASSSAEPGHSADGG
jgi:serine/threonine protein kinase/WD40 repeat protein